MINARSASKSNHFKIGPGDLVLPCPFCGNRTINADEHVDDGGIELKNTHSASYWVACPCGVEVHGESFEVGRSMRASGEAKHRKAAASALAKWNERVSD